LIKPKLLDDVCLTNLPIYGPFKEPAANGSINETSIEPHDLYLSEHLDETPTNASAISTLSTSELIIGRLSVNCPDIPRASHSSSIDDLSTSATHIQIKGDRTVDDMSLTTYRAGYEILSEFFGQPAIGLESVSNIEEHGKWPESNYRDEDPEHTGPVNTPEALDAPQYSPSTSINTVSSKDLDIPKPGLLVASTATSKSSSRGSSEPGSLSTIPTSYTSFEAHIYSKFPSRMCPVYIKRLSLNDPAP
jgi:hypothetical protein